MNRQKLSLHLTPQALHREVELRRRERDIKLEKLHGLIEQHQGMASSFELIRGWRAEIVELYSTS